MTTIEAFQREHGGTMRILNEALQGARQRTGNHNLGISVKGGLFQISEVTFAGRKTNVRPLHSARFTREQAVYFMNMLLHERDVSQ